MTDLDGFTLWDAPAEDITLARIASTKALAEAAVEPLWPYLSAASTQVEFESRLALAQPNFLSSLGQVITDPSLDPDEVRVVATSGLSQRFAEVLAQREANEAAQRLSAALKTAAAASEHAQRFVDGLNAKHGGEDTPWHQRSTFGVSPGQKMDRIYKMNHTPDGAVIENSKSAHAFVERETGHVYKPDGWKRPAKGVRYHSVDDALRHSDTTGGYLYRYASKTAGDSVEVASPRQCDICQKDQAAYDGKTQFGPWANMCEGCFAQHGVGLGTGRGQRLIVKSSAHKPDSGQQCPSCRQHEVHHYDDQGGYRYCSNCDWSDHPERAHTGAKTAAPGSVVTWYRNKHMGHQVGIVDGVMKAGQVYTPTSANPDIYVLAKGGVDGVDGTSMDPQHWTQIDTLPIGQIPKQAGLGDVLHDIYEHSPLSVGEHVYDMAHQDPDYGLFGPHQDYHLAPGQRVNVHSTGGAWGDDPQPGTVVSVAGDTAQVSTDYSGLTFPVPVDHLTPLTASLQSIADKHRLNRTVDAPSKAGGDKNYGYVGEHESEACPFCHKFNCEHQKTSAHTAGVFCPHCDYVPKHTEPSEAPWGSSAACQACGHALLMTGQGWRHSGSVEEHLDSIWVPGQEGHYSVFEQRDDDHRPVPAQGSIHAHSSKQTSAVQALFQAEGFDSTRDMADSLNGDAVHGQQPQRAPSTTPRQPSPAGQITHLHNHNDPGYGLGSEQHINQGLADAQKSMHRRVPRADPAEREQSMQRLFGSLHEASEREWLEAEAAFFHHPKSDVQDPHPGAEDSEMSRERASEQQFKRRQHDYFSRHPNEHHETIQGDESPDKARRQPHMNIPAMASRHQAEYSAYNWGYEKGQAAREGNPDRNLPTDTDTWSNEGGKGGPINWQTSDGSFTRGFRDGLAGNPKESDDFKDYGPRGPYDDDPYREASRRQANDGPYSNYEGGPFEGLTLDEIKDKVKAYQDEHGPYHTWTDMLREHRQTHAVNENAYGADRYLRTPNPATPAWISDEWGPEGRVDKKTTEEGLAGGADKPMPFNNLQTVRQSALRMLADATWYEAVQRHHEGDDWYVFDKHNRRFVDGPMSEDDARAKAATLTQQKSNSPGYKQAAGQPAQVNTGGGFGNLDGTQPANDFNERQDKPTTTKPRQMPKSTQPNLVTVETEVMPGQMGGGGGFDMGYGADPAFGGYGADSAATTMTAGDPMSPTVDQMVAAKVARLASRVQVDNPDLSPEQARQVAAHTIATYPEMVQR